MKTIIAKIYQKTLALALSFTPENYREKVLRVQKQKALVTVHKLLFAHVMKNCEINNGKFYNTKAVLEPVNISHIPFATEVFEKADIFNKDGLYEEKHPCNGSITGLISKQGLPMYRLYINMHGQLHKRIFIPQNPDKLNTNNELSAWAKEVRKGAKIMIVMKDNSPPVAHIKLEPGMPLGQEEFVIWDNK